MAWPAGTNAVSGTPISSVSYNTFLADLLADLNAPRPVTAGGTGATSPASAFEALSPMTARGDLVTRSATASKRLPIGAAGTVLSSDGLEPIWTTQVNVPPASEIAAGSIEIATEAENAARTSALLAVTPKYNPLPPGFLFGCTLSNAAADAVNDITVAAGKVRDATDATNIILASAITKKLDAAWAVGNDQGGLDTGSAANVTYHVWLIKRSDTGVVDALLSVSATAPTMPASYDYKRRIGSILREAGNIVQFRQVGDKFWRDAPSGDVNATHPGIAAVTRTLKVPIGIAVDAMVIHSVTQGNAGDNSFGLLSSLADANTTPSATVHDVVYVGNSDSSGDSVSREVTTNTSAQIRSRLSGSIAGSTVETVTTLGWIDTRGRLA
jgi:hypothetical protein